MKVLVLGGNRFFGIHLVEGLLKSGHEVTLLNRGLSGDPFGERVQRIACDRGDYDAMEKVLKGRSFDLVYDNIAYGSKDVKALLDNLDTGRYILTSSVSAYPRTEMQQPETDFDPLKYPLRWVNREDVDYGEGKRQAECAVFQHFPATAAVAVRFPYVIGPRDYTGRLRFYVENAILGKAMCIDNLTARLSFIHEEEAGRFLAGLAEAENFASPVNAAATGTVSLAETLDWVEKARGVTPVLDPGGLPGPYNGAEDFSLNTRRAEEELGFGFSRLQDWYETLLDALMAQVGNNG